MAALCLHFLSEHVFTKYTILERLYGTHFNQPILQNMGEEEFVDVEPIRKKNSEYLWKIGNLLSESCPPASRFYMFNREQNLNGNSNLFSKHAHCYCKYCGSLWIPGNYSVRIKSCPAPNHHLKKLAKIETEQPWKLNNHQKRNLRKFREKTNKIVYSCFTCQKKTTFPGDKKCKIHYRSNALSKIHPLKIKHKKGDLNAGLFISSPSCSNSSEINTSLRSPISESPSQSQVTNHTEQNNSVTPNALKKSFKNKFDIFQTPSNQKTRPQTLVSSQKQSTAKKKKKSLLDEILKEEQTNSKKPSLASFLISL